MNSICKDIFKAIHEGKWLSIEYKNKDEKVTKYWIGIKNIYLKSKSLKVEGLHLSDYTLMEFEIYIDSIISSAIIEGSYCSINEQLLEDIKLNPHKYQEIFNHVANLKILNYLVDCNKLDTTPYKCEYSLIDHFDGDCLLPGIFKLSHNQFKEIISKFQNNAIKKKPSKQTKQLALNVMSVNTKRGLYVLAYRKLRLDVTSKSLIPSDGITICSEFTIHGEKESVRQFLDAEDYYLLEDFEKNLEIIKDKITRNNKHINGVDDMPYMIAIGRDIILDLNHEYSAIIEMYNSGTVSYPIKAFFGELVKRQERRKEYPIALLNKKVNLDQLLAINNAIKYPITYVQGPPGTGKTNTIINTLTTAFFNEKTVLFVSYNNHPIDSVFDILKAINHRGVPVPFPVIRLGNNEKMGEAISYIQDIYNRTKKITIYPRTLERNKDDKIEKTKRLTELLKKHNETIDMLERKETIEKLLSTNKNLNFNASLQSRQLKEVNDRLDNIDKVTDEEALSLLADDIEEFIKYLYYVSANYIKKLDEPKNQELLDIINMDKGEMQVKEFNQYLSNDENMKKFLKIFPIVITTSISAHKLGEPKQYFDMVIMDEASQCNLAVALVPIIRGESMMLVGDPQQLNPVILLDVKDNLTLKRNYHIPNEYDYITNSIYKTYLACDAVSDEILLSYHYRCNKKIIEFNNKKYYNNKLIIKSNSNAQTPLQYVNIEDNRTAYKNTAPTEAEKIVQYAGLNKDKKIGVITPFVNQKNLINSLLKENGLDNVTCGTVHAFQGDEKDVILFSLAITDQTHSKTYDWLKNNKELINVATSRAKEQLIILSSSKNLERLHQVNSEDDVHELVEYVKTNGISEVTGKSVTSRALGVKPYSTEIEDAFLMNLNHALDNALHSKRKCVIHKEVGIAHVFRDNPSYNDLFYSGRFDFVVYETGRESQEFPIFAIELDGKEHIDDNLVMERDRKKNEICRAHGFELIRIENSYARRYNYVKDILMNYFAT